MKKSIILTAGVLAVFAVGSIQADDTKMTKKSKPAPAMKESTSSLPADRELELRIGPRMSVLTGDTRIGVTGTTFDVWDDLKLDEPSAGIQMDADYQPFNRWHAMFGFTWDNYDHSGTTAKDLKKAGNETDRLLAGATVNADMDIYTFEGKIGYDVVKNNTYKLMPYIGGKGAVIDGKLTISGTAVSGTVNTAFNQTFDTSKSKNELAEGTFIGGVDQKLNISRNWYIGVDVAGFGWDRVGYITGDGYTGYDFTKSLGVRAGYSFDWATYKNSNDTLKTEPMLGAGYVQFVRGF